MKKYNDLVTGLVNAFAETIFGYRGVQNGSDGRVGRPGSHYENSMIKMININVKRIVNYRYD